MGLAPQPSDFEIVSRLGDDEFRSSLAGWPGVEVVLNLLLSYSSQTRPLTAPRIICVNESPSLADATMMEDQVMHATQFGASVCSSDSGFAQAVFAIA